MSVYFTPADGSTTWPVCRRCPGIALDLDSSRTRAWMPGHGIILDVPTITVEGAAGSHPIQRGTIVDPEGTTRMLQHHLGPRIPRHTRPLIALTTPVLGGIAYRKAARAALEVLRPRTVLTIPIATAVALGAGADMSRPLLIVDIGAHLTEVFLLIDGSVVDAHRTVLGTDDLDQATTHRTIADAVTGTVTDMLTGTTPRRTSTPSKVASSWLAAAPCAPVSPTSSRKTCTCPCGHCPPRTLLPFAEPRNSCSPPADTLPPPASSATDRRSSSGAAEPPDRSVRCSAGTGLFGIEGERAT